MGCLARISRRFKLFFDPARTELALTVTYDYVDLQFQHIDKRVYWNDIKTKEIVNLDVATYDEVALILWDNNGNYVAVGELDKEFKGLLEMTELRCPGFHANFFPTEPFADLGIRKTVWTRA